MAVRSSSLQAASSDSRGRRTSRAGSSRAANDFRASRRPSAAAANQLPRAANVGVQVSKQLVANRAAPTRRLPDQNTPHSACGPSVQRARLSAPAQLFPLTSASSMPDMSDTDRRQAERELAHIVSDCYTAFSQSVQRSILPVTPELLTAVGMVDTPADGNCLFSAVSHQMFRHFHAASDLRALVSRALAGDTDPRSVSYTHLTLPTILLV